MKYDFTTRVNRQGQGSLKWEDMYAKKADVAKDVIPLSVADMEFKNPPEIIEGLKKYLDHVVLGYTGPTKEYKQAVVDWMKGRHNFDIQADWIVNTAGVVPAFFNAIRSFSEEGDGIIIMSPVYYPFYNAIQKQQRKIVDCPLLENNGYYTIDYDKFEMLAKDSNNKMLLFCSPHNPVGRVWKREELERLADLIIKYDLILLSDEIHFDLIMPGYEQTVFQTVREELAERTITFTAPSKTFNLAGMGMSNTIIKNAVFREKFQKGLEDVSALPMTALGYKACEIAYRECENWLEECIQVIDTNQKVMKKFFEEKYPQIKCPLIEGTYLQWVDFRALGMTPEELERFMIEEAELFLDEGYIFGEAGKGYERFNLAAPTVVIEESLKRLDRALQTRKEL